MRPCRDRGTRCGSSLPSSSNPTASRTRMTSSMRKRSPKPWPSRTCAAQDPGATRLAGKDATLGKHKTLSTLPPPRRRRLKKFYQGLRRREQDERTVQRRVGKPGGENASRLTEGFIRTNTRGSSSSARRNDSLQRGRIHLRGLFLRPTSTLLQFGGGPYILANNRNLLHRKKRGRNRSLPRRLCLLQLQIPRFARDDNPE